ncbi:MAG: DNA glycosylase [Bacillota bacterium]
MRDDVITLRANGDFSLVHTFSCGQAFRWREQDSSRYLGTVGNYAVEITVEAALMAPPNAAMLRIAGPGIAGTEAFWTEYLDLKRDYDSLCAGFAALDEHMARAIDFSRGLRLLKQPFFEVLISFIISQNNNVPRISGIIERISLECGTQLTDYAFAFPTPEQLARLTETDFARLGAGYRSSYLAKITRLYLEGRIDAESLSASGFHHARNTLIALPGIGPKVADCVLLFGGIHYEAFPSDVWVKRVMGELYGLVGGSDIFHFAESYFGPYAGIAQQYLFNMARKG